MGATPRVVVLGLGGTIAMTDSEAGGAQSGDSRSDGSASGGLVPKLSAQQLINAVPRLGSLGVELEAKDFRRVPGGSLTFDDMRELSIAIDGYLASGAAGVVLTQGTDSIEETAYALDLAHAGPAPIVVTGAMRSATQAGADGPANLLAAVTVAASSAARSAGTLVVMADEIHAAARVQKTHTTSVTAFRSPDFGPLGYVTEGRVHLSGSAVARTVIDPPRDGVNPRVCLVTMCLGDDGYLLEAISDNVAGPVVNGLVVAGFGVGHVPRDLVPTLDKLAGVMPVVLSSRIPAGASLTATYGYPGSEKDLLARGLISSGQLDPLKARVLLRALLGAGHGHETIAATFATAGGYAEPYP